MQLLNYILVFLSALFQLFLERLHLLSCLAESLFLFSQFVPDLCVLILLCVKTALKLFYLQIVSLALFLQLIVICLYFSAYCLLLLQ